MRTLLKIDTDSRLIVSLSLIYGFILLFPAFGPIMRAVVSIEQGSILSASFLLSLGLSFYLIPRHLKKAYHPRNRLFNILTVILTVTFAWIPFPLRIFTMAAMGLVTGRLVVFWSHQLMVTETSRAYGRLFLSILFISYSGLYIANSLSAWFPPKALMLIAALILSGAIYYCECFFDPTVPSYRSPVDLPARFLLPVFLIYLTAGITYTGVYPAITDFQSIDRYYNVLPFLVALPLGYLLMKKAGQKTLLLTGMSLLGFAFLLFIYPLGFLNYVLIQTSLQAGWAFVDLFMWMYAAHIARIYNYPFYLNYVIGTFLIGTGLGSFLFSNLLLFSPAHMTFIALLLLLVSFVFVTMIPNDLKSEMALSETGLFSSLTNRERQITFMLLKNMTGNEIANELNISLNTLKKHASKIYHKLDVKNKTDLIRTYKKKDA